MGRECSFPSSGVPTLTVAARTGCACSRRARTSAGSRFPIPALANFPLPDFLVASYVSAENLLVPVFDPVGAALSILLGGVEIAAVADTDDAQKVIRKQEGESDFDFLAIVARENGWEMFIDHGGPLGGWTLRFLSPLDQLERRRDPHLRRVADRVLAAAEHGRARSSR